MHDENSSIIKCIVTNGGQSLAVYLLENISQLTVKKDCYELRGAKISYSGKIAGRVIIPKDKAVIEYYNETEQTGLPGSLRYVKNL